MFYVSDEPKGKFVYTETTKLYCIELYCNDIAQYNYDMEIFLLQLMLCVNCIVRTGLYMCAEYCS